MLRKKGMGLVGNSRPIVAHRFDSLVTKRSASSSLQVNLPAAIPQEQTSLCLTSSSKNGIAPWVPFRRVRVATHSVEYGSSDLDIEEINKTEALALESFVETRGSDELMVMVGGEDTHAGLGDLYDLTSRMNFWKSAVKTKAPVIVQTSANYFRVGDQYVNCAIVADFIRSTTHVLVKGSVADPIDRFCESKGYPKDTMILGGPRVTTIGSIKIGHGICLDAHHLADLMMGEPGIYNIAVLSSFGDPSSGSLFPKNTLKIVQDHQSPFGKGGSVKQVGRPPRSFLDELYLMCMAEASESGTEHRSSTQITPKASQDEVELVFDVAPSGTAAVPRKLQSTSSNGRLIKSRLDVYHPLPLKMHEYMPAPRPVWELWLNALKDKITE